MASAQPESKFIELKPFSDEMIVNMGPQHPSTHGVLRLELKLDGEVVREAIPHIGYLHRCFEKHSENLSYPQIIPFTDRMDYIAQTGMAASHFDSMNDPAEAMEIVDGRISLVGNINNPVTLYSKGPEVVREEVYKALDAGVQLIAPECAIPLRTKLENLLEIPAAVHDWTEAQA